MKHTHQNGYPARAQFGETGLVGLDCMALPTHFSGAAHYISHLASHLLSADRPFRLAIFCKPAHAPLFKGLLKQFDRLITVPLRNRLEQLYWYEFRLRQQLLDEQVDVFYATHYICPPVDPRYHIITTCHDMGFLLYPRYYPLVKRIYFGRRMKTFLRRASTLVAVSDSTASDLVKCFPDQQEKITVIHPGTDHIAHALSPLPENGSSHGPRILSVNTFEKRKRIPFVIDVFNELKQRHKIPHSLWIIGQPANDLREIRKAIASSPFDSHIYLMTSVADAALRQYYQQASLFINASEYEGFGFTPFEAVRADLPAFLYRNNTVAELFDNHPYFFTDYDAVLWADRINAALEAGFPERLGADAVAELTWASAAGKTVELLERIISGLPTGREESRVLS